MIVAPTLSTVRRHASPPGAARRDIVIRHDLRSPA
ncbi:hypothetical protein SAMN05444006_12746 [Allgaiera indica]|uniref:Uncharacterized protein n=1 Tax=Allgaiera indica TaxID=765699 RepID=A0A1H3E7Z8_9RHOB|nr:hypothetical protein SAMN05444006_12746 [Allgaiera indica]